MTTKHQLSTPVDQEQVNRATLEYSEKLIARATRYKLAMEEALLFARIGDMRRVHEILTQAINS